jgi:hypothetical protein
MIYDKNTPPKLIQIGKKLEEYLKSDLPPKRYKYVNLDKTGTAFLSTTVEGWHGWKYADIRKYLPRDLYTWLKKNQNWEQCVFKLGDKT